MTEHHRQPGDRTDHRSHDEALATVLDAMGALVDAAVVLAPDDPARTARAGRTAAELLVEAHLGLNRMIRGSLMVTGRAVAEASDCPHYRPDDDAAPGSEHRRFVRGVAAAYASPRRVVDDLAATVDAASVAVVALPPGVLLLDGRSVCTGDFLGAWALHVERRLGALGRVAAAADLRRAVGPDVSAAARRRP